MGLCKCRVVTSLFCFQHTTNVCEKCMIEDHPNCVVKTYLQWLNDTDFDPNCQLCKAPLDDGRDTIRLPCFDVFHWECLDKYCKSFPAHTAPAGFSCPVCRAAIIPASSNMSPVAQKARQQLSKTEWATRAGDQGVNGTASPRKAPARSITNVDAAQATSTTATNGSGGLVSRGRAMPTQDHVAHPMHDVDDDKYGSKPPNEWFERIVKAHAPSLNKSRRRTAVRNDGDANLKRNVILAVLLIVLLITLIELFTRARPTDVSNDPLLDPMMNPNIRSAE
eukprot:TRINITY_DN184_c0_g1_i1.p1 TRINITY_DN184_c0_g1~~TRINITY_DN184_c0_g1_i1.p1  ORF type:complete len:279 (+),score=25.37 TRINITY_DN184_c0_g1_i1:136-972(+)